MSQQATSVGDLFRRAQAIRRENPNLSYKEVRAQLAREFDGKPFPSFDRLAIPEQDARAPEEDWSSGLSLVRRGIQLQDWKEVANGIVLSLEQTENYEKQRGPLTARDEWHDRTVGIQAPLTKGVGKWMPEDLMKLAERKIRDG